MSDEEAEKAEEENEEDDLEKKRVLVSFPIRDDAVSCVLLLSVHIHYSVCIHISCNLVTFITSSSHHSPQHHSHNSHNSHHSHNSPHSHHSHNSPHSRPTGYQSQANLQGPPIPHDRGVRLPQRHRPALPSPSPIAQPQPPHPPPSLHARPTLPGALSQQDVRQRPRALRADRVALRRCSRTHSHSLRRARRWWASQQQRR